MARSSISTSASPHHHRRRLAFTAGHRRDHVDVTPVAAAPTLDPRPKWQEDAKSPLDITAGARQTEADACCRSRSPASPAGATLSAGTLNLDGSYTLTPAQLGGLTLTSDGEVQHFDLGVTATTTDGGSPFTAGDQPARSTSMSRPSPTRPTLSVADAQRQGGHPDRPRHHRGARRDRADAVLSIKVSGVPAGATLSAGTLNLDGSYTLTPAQLGGLTLTSDGEVQHFDLGVTATTTDGGSPFTAATTGAIHVDVTPVADAPTLSVADASGIEGQPTALVDLRVSQ